MTVYIGTSGFDYPEWKGIFYPAELKRKDFLSYYSTVFNALEINSTFYNMPSMKQMLSFYERSEGRLTFSIKANRCLTHEISRDWKEQAKTFEKAIEVLGNYDVLGPVLFQLPPTFDYSVANRKFLANLLQEFKNFKPVVEFRNPGWIKESVFEGLVSRSASLVFVDMPQQIKKADGLVITPFIGANAYIRYHNRPNKKTIIEINNISAISSIWFIYYNHSDGIIQAKNTMLSMNIKPKI